MKMKTNLSLDQVLSSVAEHIRQLPPAGSKVELLYDLQSESVHLPAGTVLRVSISNPAGIRAVDPNGYVHVIDHKHYRQI